MKVVVQLPKPLYTFTGLSLSPQSIVFMGTIEKIFALDSISCLFKEVISMILFEFISKLAWMLD